MSKILVTGAGGFVGANVVPRLAEQGFDCLGLDLHRGELEEKFPMIQGDILDENHLDRVLENVSIIVHLAVSNLRTSIKNPKRNVKINVNGTLNILEAARERGVGKIVYASASSVYGTPRYVPVDEDHPKFPTTVYGITKYASEHLLRVYHRLYGLDYFILRFTNVYGPKQHLSTGGLVPVALNKIHAGETMQVYGDGSQTRDFVYVGDLARMIVDIVSDEEKKNMIVNAGTGKEVSILQVIETCGRVLGIEPELEFKKQEAGERKRFCADETRCREAFGYAPDTSLQEGIELTADWFRTSVWLHGNKMDG